MKLSPKAIFAIAIVAALVGAGIYAQMSASSVSKSNYNLTAQEMETLVSEVLPPQQQQQLASSPEQKKQLAERLKNMMALAQEAERNGFADKADVQSQLSLQGDLVLKSVYEKRNPGAQAAEEETAKYLAEHPNEFEQFLEANPRFKAQAQGPQLEGMKKEFAQIKIIAARARADKLDQEESFKVRMRIERSSVLANAFVSDLQENADKLVTDADVEAYYNENPNEFNEVKARHILVSTEPLPTPPGVAPDAKDEAKKPLTKEEARKKAEALRERALKGEDFTKLAAENSDEPGAKERGGDLGFFTKEAMVPEFSNVAFAMQPGQISEVVETQFGFHVIKLEERRTKQLDDAATRQAITEKLKEKKIEERIKQIADNSGVQVAEEFNITPPPVESPQLSLPTPGAAPAPGSGNQ